jgi:hypothetical protein
LLPLAYFLTFCTYGTHLPGDENGWVDSQHSMPFSPMLPRDPHLEAKWKSRLNESPFLLDENARHITLYAVLSVCSHRRWTAHAVHVRTTHVHAAIAGEAAPERMLSDFKAYATRSFRTKAAILRRRYWADHGSTRYLWNETSLAAATNYILDGQGVRMAYHPATLETEPEA